jgi:hypothetical protein
MNLISGRVMAEDESRACLEKLDDLILATHLGKPLSAEVVMTACDTLSKRLNEEQHLPLLIQLGMPEAKARRELALVRQMLSRDYLAHRLAVEFGPPFEASMLPFGHGQRVRKVWKPLGTLLHIAAGNVDALPVFSVIEGLLTGNINILKLPGSEGGLSIPILQEMIQIAPEIAPFVFVFDTPSSDLEAMEKMAACSDAIIVWGGDAAVRAVRQLAGPDTRLIEWGHKISFAYVSGEAVADHDLEGLAFNICDTQQLLCSSCQGIYLDTDRFDAVVDFAKRFLNILDQKAAEMPERGDPYLAAQKTLELMTEGLEFLKMEKKVFKTGRCSVTAYSDPALYPSYLFRNCWVKPLPQRALLSALLPYKNHLQTAALICDPDQKPELEALLAQTGIVRITSGERMSTTYCGMPHDGEYPLRRYMKIVSYED